MTPTPFQTEMSLELNGMSHLEPPEVARGHRTTRVIAVASVPGVTGLVGVTAVDDLGR